MPGLIHPSRRSFKPFKLRSRPSLVMACRFFGSVPDFPSPPRLHYPRSDGLLAAPRLHRFPVPLDTPPPVEVRPRGYCPPQRTDRTYMYNRIHSQTDAVSPPTSPPRSEKGQSTQPAYISHRPNAHASETAAWARLSSVRPSAG